MHSHRFCLINQRARCHRITLFHTFYPCLRIQNVLSYLYKLLLILTQSYAQSMAYSHGTRVLLEVNSINNLIEYFKNLYKPDVLFELKGIKITVSQYTDFKYAYM